MKFTYKKAGIEDLDMLVKTRIEVLRAANRLADDTDMSLVERDYRLFKGKTRQYLCTSSASAYHKPAAGYIVNEGTTLDNLHWQYSRDKIACEEFLMQKYREDRRLWKF